MPPADFNQGLIELGAIVCVPNGGPKCEQCPVKEYCIAHAENLTAEIPVKKKAKARKIEERTVLIFKDGKQIATRKRPGQKDCWPDYMNSRIWKENFQWLKLRNTARRLV